MDQDAGPPPLVSGAHVDRAQRHDGLRPHLVVVGDGPGAGAVADVVRPILARVRHVLDVVADLDQVGVEGILLGRPAE